MPGTTQTQPRFASLSEFLERPEELATVDELCAVGPWKPSQLRYWLYESERNVSFRQARLTSHFNP